MSNRAGASPDKVRDAGGKVFTSEVVGTDGKPRSFSFLVRLWRAPRTDTEAGGAWIGEVRQVATGETIRFRGLANLTRGILKLTVNSKRVSHLAEAAGIPCYTRFGEREASGWGEPPRNLRVRSEEVFLSFVRCYGPDTVGLLAAAPVSLSRLTSAGATSYRPAPASPVAAPPLRPHVPAPSSGTCSSSTFWLRVRPTAKSGPARPFRAAI